MSSMPLGLFCISLKHIRYVSGNGTEVSTATSVDDVFSAVACLTDDFQSCPPIVTRVATQEGAAPLPAVILFFEEKVSKHDFLLGAGAFELQGNLSSSHYPFKNLLKDYSEGSSKMTIWDTIGSKSDIDSFLAGLDQADAVVEVPKQLPSKFESGRLYLVRGGYATSMAGGEPLSKQLEEPFIALAVFQSGGRSGASGSSFVSRSLGEDGMEKKAHYGVGNKMSWASTQRSVGTGGGGQKELQITPVILASLLIVLFTFLVVWILAGCIMQIDTPPSFEDKCLLITREY
eukprot:GHVU01137526.1.p1 GENE.GHVU01137526.1~~GHVU01137526.1.p1  ORF type:complete len:289 (-),score=30.26 GHVU01137526.1:209-1075(-)